MDRNNSAAKIKREVFIRVAKAFLEGKLNKISEIPNVIRPKNSDNSRCCIYMDREVIRYRCLAAMGYSIENLADDHFDLADSAQNYKTKSSRNCSPNEVMTIIDIACKGCASSRYFVTDACQGCVARPCMNNCPFNAIEFKNNKAFINKEKCKNCGKCLSQCPFNAITKISLPCEEVCPVGAISKNSENRAEIDYSKCIFCGKCISACPFGAVMERSSMVDVINVIKSEKHVTAMIAPAVTGQFPGSLEKLHQALLDFGFSNVVEVAKGAEMTLAQEGAEMIERLEKGEPFMTSSCCPAYVEAVKKHVPALLEHLSTTLSPMSLIARKIKGDNPETTTVFIGPCTAKRHEANSDSNVDFVLTFEEMGSLFVAADQDVAEKSEKGFEESCSAEGRAFPVSGNVASGIKAMTQCRTMLIDGLDKKNMAKLKALKKIAKDTDFVEVMACSGGCIAGPGRLGSRKNALKCNQELCGRS